MRRILSALCLSTALGLTAALPAHAADAPVTPSAPTVVDECGLGQDRVTIPDIAGVQYLVEIDGTVVQLTAGDYAGVAFWPEDAMSEEELDELVFGDAQGVTLPDASATITAEAVDGAVLAEGATTSFDVALSSTPCAPEHAAVTAVADCGTVTFSNPAGNPEVLVLWGDADSDEDYSELVLAPGASRTVRTDAEEVDWFAVEEEAWTEEDWEDEEWATSLGSAATPDYVATEDDRLVLQEVAEFFDALLAADLGGGLLELPADCPAPEDTTPDEDTPEIPAVVQTDGVEQPSLAAPLLLGGLTALIAWSVVRPRRQS
ncbi:MAG: hypothetical protein L0G89_14065 [Janibacter sp.]|nr:hypothetical protein [Janibacter sp.]